MFLEGAYKNYKSKYIYKPVMSFPVVNVKRRWNFTKIRGELSDRSKEKIKKNNFSKFPITGEGVSIIFGNARAILDSTM